jgi:GH24 family phage-related lysozyme (muramidase)
VAESSPNRRRAGLVAAALAIAAPAEGIRQVAYYDPPGILTVCEGHTGPDVVKGKVYSLAECRALADADMGRTVDRVSVCAPGAPDSVLVAFSDAAYNLGPIVACDRQRSTAARLLWARQWRGACEQLPRWDKATVAGVSVSLPGLTKRRAHERDVCLAGLPPAP